MANGKNLFSTDVMILDISSDLEDQRTMRMGLLTLWKVYMEVHYYDVLYNQITLTSESDRGRLITFCNTLTLDEFLQPDYKEAAKRYAADQTDPEFIELRRLSAEGYRIHVHYMKDNRKYIVLAEDMQVVDLVENYDPLASRET